ncbi:MAG: hypothetical protein RL172_2629, partial [Bacteroidota bacterium]
MHHAYQSFSGLLGALASVFLNRSCRFFSCC